MRIQGWESFEGGEERWEKINIYSPNLYFLIVLLVYIFCYNNICGLKTNIIYHLIYPIYTQSDYNYLQ